MVGRTAWSAPRDVQFSSIDFDTSVIEVHNFGDSSQSLANWRFCTHDDNQIRQYSFTNALNTVNLGAGESMFVHFNNDAPGGATDAFNIASLGPFATPLDQGPYSINLYLNSNFTSPPSMVDHVQWSIGGVDDFIADERSLVAQNAGLWTDESQWVVTADTTVRLELDLDNLGNPPPGPHGPTSYLVVESPPLSPADIDGDGDVDSEDLAYASAIALLLIFVPRRELSLVNSENHRERFPKRDKPPANCLINKIGNTDIFARVPGELHLSSLLY